MSTIIEDFDISEWREFLPGIYCMKDDATVIAFKCSEGHKQGKRDPPSDPPKGFVEEKKEKSENKS